MLFSIFSTLGNIMKKIKKIQYNYILYKFLYFQFIIIIIIKESINNFFSNINNYEVNLLLFFLKSTI